MKTVLQIVDELVNNKELVNQLAETITKTVYGSGDKSVPEVRDRPIFCTDLNIQTMFGFWQVDGFVEAVCSNLGPGNNPYTVKGYDYPEVYSFFGS